MTAAQSPDPSAEPWPPPRPAAPIGPWTAPPPPTTTRVSWVRRKQVQLVAVGLAGALIGGGIASGARGEEHFGPRFGGMDMMGHPHHGPGDH
jgi:hypothetical protein